MSDNEQEKRLQELLKEEREKLQAVEQERAFLKDRSVAGSYAPRPTDNSIDQSLGKQNSSANIERIAREKAEQRVEQERQNQLREDKRQQSIRDHNAGIAKQNQEQAQPKRQSFAERLRSFGKGKEMKEAEELAREQAEIERQRKQDQDRQR